MSDIRKAALERTDEPFNVVQFFPDGSYEYVRRGVPAKQAVEAAFHYTHSVGAMAGVTRKVIITDGGDSLVFEWRFGEGVVFPTPEQRADAQGHRKYTKEPK